MDKDLVGEPTLLIVPSEDEGKVAALIIKAKYGIQDIDITLVLTPEQVDDVIGLLENCKEEGVTND